MRSSAPREDGAARRSAHSRPGILADDLGTMTAMCLGERPAVAATVAVAAAATITRPMRVQSASGISAVSPDRIALACTCT